MTEENDPAPVTVLLPVYGGDDPDFLAEALDSIIAQKHGFTEFLVVADGPLSRQIDAVIAERAAICPAIRCLRISENKGLANALKMGVMAATEDFVARMDADDISAPDRLITQFEYLRQRPHIAAVGGQIIEFELPRTQSHRVRRVPLDPLDIRAFARRRNPINHMTVMFRRSAVLSVGNYENWPGFEDYHLWAKMLAQGYVLANLSAVLVQARTLGMHRRRGGADYLLAEMRFRREILALGISSRQDLLISMAAAMTIRLLPNRIRRLVYDKVLRHGASGCAIRPIADGPPTNTRGA